MGTAVRMGVVLGVFAASAMVCAQTGDVTTGDAMGLYRAGDRVDVTDAVARDAVVAGRSVRIAAPIRGDVLAAGWNVTLDGRAHDDVRIAGGHVTVNASVSGDLTAAGGDVTVGPNARVGGRTFLTGQTVRIEGVLDQDARVAGALVQIAGDIRQPAIIVADRVEFLPTARVHAPITYRSPQRAWIATGATVAAPVTFVQVDPREARASRTFAGFSSVLFVLQVGLAGFVLVLLAPRLSGSVVGTLRRQPWQSLTVGFAVLVAAPVATLVLLVSILGIPAAIALGATYVVALIGGLVTTALLIGELEMRRLHVTPSTGLSQRLVFLLAGVVTLGLLRLIPVLGALAVLASVTGGLGALVLATYRSSLQRPSVG